VEGLKLPVKWVFEKHLGPEKVQRISVRRPLKIFSSFSAESQVGSGAFRHLFCISLCPWICGAQRGKKKTVIAQLCAPFNGDMRRRDASEVGDPTPLFHH
jgi:hypothetical protein